MKTMSKLLALLTALCLLAGCAAMGQTENPQGSGQDVVRTDPASTEAAPTAENAETTPFLKKRSLLFGEYPYI